MTDVKYREATPTPDPKIIAQAITTLVLFLAGYFGLDLDPELAAPLSVLIGFALGYVIRPAQTVPEAPAEPEVYVPQDR